MYKLYLQKIIMLAALLVSFQNGYSQIFYNETFRTFLSADETTLIKPALNNSLGGLGTYDIVVWKLNQNTKSSFVLSGYSDIISPSYKYKAQNFPGATDKNFKTLEWKTIVDSIDHVDMYSTGITKREFQEKNYVVAMMDDGTMVCSTPSFSKNKLKSLEGLYLHNPYGMRADKEILKSKIWNTKETNTFWELNTDGRYLIKHNDKEIVVYYLQNATEQVLVEYSKPTLRPWIKPGKNFIQIAHYYYNHIYDLATAKPVVKSGLPEGNFVNDTLYNISADKTVTPYVFTNNKAEELNKYAFANFFTRTLVKPTYSMLSSTKLLIASDKDSVYLLNLKTQNLTANVLKINRAAYTAPVVGGGASAACNDAKAALQVKVGTWVREGKGGPVLLLDYDCNAKQYIGEARFASPTALNTTTFPIYVFEVSSSLGNSKYQVINVHTCRKCNGAGTISGKRNYEKVDYGIYYKYTTSGTVTFTDVCEECKGHGVIAN